MHLFLTEVSDIIIQTLACSLPFGLLQRTDAEKRTNFSREESHHRQPPVGIKVLWLTYSTISVPKAGKSGMGLCCIPGGWH